MESSVVQGALRPPCGWHRGQRSLGTTSRRKEAPEAPDAAGEAGGPRHQFLRRLHLAAGKSRGSQSGQSGHRANLFHEDAPSSAPRGRLLSLLLGEEGLQFHQFLYQKGIQLSALQCCLLGSGEAARHLDLPSSSPLSWDGEILKF